MKKIEQSYVTLAVKVIPRASKTEVTGKQADGTWKVKVAAVPEKGKANEMLCEALAEYFRVPKDNVTVISGQSARLKRVRIFGRELF